MPKTAKQATELNINLIPKEPVGFFDATVRWALNIGRYLVIFTEVVALAIFLLSIKLSADKNTLKEDIQTLTSQVAAQSAFENEFRTVTNRLSQVKSLKAGQFKANLAVKEFLSLLPTGMTLDLLKLEKNEFIFSGSFLTPTQLQTMVLSFSKSDKLVGLDIRELKTPERTRSGFTFTAAVTINKAGFNQGSGQ